MKRDLRATLPLYAVIFLPIMTTMGRKRKRRKYGPPSKICYMSIESYRQSFSFVCPMSRESAAELCQIKCSLRQDVFARDHYQPRVVTAILTIRETDAALVELDIRRGRDFSDLCYTWHIIDTGLPRKHVWCKNMLKTIARLKLYKERDSLFRYQ